MTPERYQQINRLFHEALEQTGEHRAEFLRQACGDDQSLRLEVERMIAAHEHAGNFLNTPAFAPSLIHKESAQERARQSGQQTGLIIGSEIGRYRILSKLGEGGMGVVFLAEDTILERRVALKLLPAEYTLDRDRVRRFEQEARAASALNHPNIITIHEIGQADILGLDLHFIAEEYIEGQTLRRRIRNGGLSLLDALDVAVQAANALHVAHATGIVHRDVKPENIMLRPDGFIKILDFGLAKLLEPETTRSTLNMEYSAPLQSLTAPGAILGTAAYMSPEQARGLDIDARSDIWSLGVVLYETLTGQAPFGGGTAADVIVSIIDREPPPLSRTASKTPPELERIVMKALAKNRDERYQTANDLAIDLKSLKRRLEFDAEYMRMSDSLPRRKSSGALAGGLAGAPATTEEHATRRTDARDLKTLPLSNASLQHWRNRQRWLPVAAFFLAMTAIGIAVWPSLRPKPSVPAFSTMPERIISYSLTSQRMRDGHPYREPFESSGQEFFESGCKIRFNFSSPQSGYLYLLNEDGATNSAVSFSVLFPFPSINNGSAQMIGGRPIQTGWNFLNERPGKVRLLLVWAAQPVVELEAVKDVVNPIDKGVISDPAEISAVRRFLNQHAQAKPQMKIDQIKKRTDITGRSEILVHPFELEHR